MPHARDTDQAFCGMADWGFCIAASGNRMPNLGEKKVHFKTKDGLNSSITFQVTKVKKPLAAVSKITEKGNWVCFGPSEAYIENVATGKRTK